MFWWGTAGVVDFEKWMPEYGSLRWPIETMRSCCANASNVVRNLRGWGDGEESSRIVIMAGDEDMWMGAQKVEDMARDYGQEVRTLVRGKRLTSSVGCTEAPQSRSKGIDEDSDTGVSMVVVKGAGHHMQHDVQAERVAGL